jgi:hypothetical protein
MCLIAAYQDVCWSLYVGRDFCVPELARDTTIPVPFVDSEFDQILWHYPPSGIPPQPNMLSCTFAETCNLLKIARRIMDVLCALRPYEIAAAIVEVYLFVGRE